MSDWLTIERGEAPLIVAFPHTGTFIPEPILERLASPWLARVDADWWVDQLYDFAATLGATTVRTAMSRTVIDVNRAPTGASLYPGQETTDLCPLTTFDGEALYRDGMAPDEREIHYRREQWFSPYHSALAAESARLRRNHGCVVLYDAHSIRSRIPRLFEGELPCFNIGTNGGTSCDVALRDTVASSIAAIDQSIVVDGRFRGGWTTRHYGQPATGVHAIQMELAQRTYMKEPTELTPQTWPPPYDLARADAVRATLRAALAACLQFAEQSGSPL